MFSMKNELVLCSCNNTEHQLLFLGYEDSEIGNEVYIHIHLPTQSFWKRLKHGIKYILGYKSRYGDFDEIVLNKDHAKQFSKVVNFLDPSKVF